MGVAASMDPVDFRATAATDNLVPVVISATSLTVSPTANANLAVVVEVVSVAEVVDDLAEDPQRQGLNSIPMNGKSKAKKKKKRVSQIKLLLLASYSKRKRLQPRFIAP